MPFAMFNVYYQLLLLIRNLPVATLARVVWTPALLLEVVYTPARLLELVYISALL